MFTTLAPPEQVAKRKKWLVVPIVLFLLLLLIVFCCCCRENCQKWSCCIGGGGDDGGGGAAGGGAQYSGTSHANPMYDATSVDSITNTRGGSLNNEAYESLSAAGCADHGQALNNATYEENPGGDDGGDVSSGSHGFAVQNSVYDEIHLSEDSDGDLDV